MTVDVRGTDAENRRRVSRVWQMTGSLRADTRENMPPHETLQNDPRIINVPTIRRRAGNEHLWTVEFRDFFHLVVVNDPRGLIQAIGERFEVCRHCRNFLRRRLIPVGAVRYVYA